MRVCTAIDGGEGRCWWLLECRSLGDERRERETRTDRMEIIEPMCVCSVCVCVRESSPAPGHNSKVGLKRNGIKCLENSEQISTENMVYTTVVGAINTHMHIDWNTWR